MDYKVVVTSDAEEDLDRFLQYLRHLSFHIAVS